MAQFVPVWASVLSGLPVLLLHVGTTMSLWLAGWWLARQMIPKDADDNPPLAMTPRSVQSAGEAVALAIPLAACLATSVNVADVLLWGAIVVLLQLLFSAASRLVASHIGGVVGEDRVDGAIHLALVRNGFALINAAAIGG